VRAMCQGLHKMREDLAAMWLHAHILDQVGDKLKEQAAEKSGCDQTARSLSATMRGGTPRWLPASLAISLNRS